MKKSTKKTELLLQLNYLLQKEFVNAEKFMPTVFKKKGNFNLKKNSSLQLLKV